MEKTLKGYIEKEQTKIFKKYGGFFAFSSQQVKEQINPKVKKYVNIGVGLICPKENAEKLIKDLDELNKKSIKKHMKKDTINSNFINNFFKLFLGLVFV